MIDILLGQVLSFHADPFLSRSIVFNLSAHCAVVTSASHRHTTAVQRSEREGACVRAQASSATWLWAQSQVLDLP